MITWKEKKNASFSWLSCLFLPLLSSSAFAAPTKPISDQDWNAIAGGRLSDRYEITKGDTLWGISKRLFGDGFYWPKIWAINNKVITNPHLIKPGNFIVFRPGSGTTLPSIALNRLGTSSYTQPDTSSSRKGRRSQEWRDLPKQPWEEFTSQLPPTVDPQGFDERNRVTFSRSTGFEVPGFATTQEITPLGVIRFSPVESRRLSLGDVVFIEAKDRLETNRTYSITAKPVEISAGETARTGYAYQNIAKIKVTDTKDNLYQATIISAREPVTRGALVIAEVNRVQNYIAQPGPDPIDANILIDRSFSSYSSAQHKFVYLDRGSEDGVEPGMVFRVYQNKDSSNGEQISTGETLQKADIIVVKTTEQFSTGLVLDSRLLIEELDIAYLLTDVSDVSDRAGTVKFEKKVEPPILEEPEEDLDLELEEEADDLDSLDTEEGLSESEEKELQQLEDFKAKDPPNDLPDDLREEDLDDIDQELDEAIEEDPLSGEFDDELLDEIPEEEFSDEPPTANFEEPTDAPDDGLDDGLDEELDEPFFE